MEEEISIAMPHLLYVGKWHSCFTNLGVKPLILIVTSKKQIVTWSEVYDGNWDLVEIQNLCFLVCKVRSIWTQKKVCKFQNYEVYWILTSPYIMLPVIILFVLYGEFRQYQQQKSFCFHNNSMKHWSCWFSFP